LASDGGVEHATECDTIDRGGMDAEPYDPARVLIHDNQDPVATQRRRLALNRSILQRLSFMWPRNVSQDGPPESGSGR
jgi:hypothetical protein